MSMWMDKWIEDIDLLKTVLIRKHRNLFFNITRECFEEKIQMLKNMVEELDYNDMKVEISRIVASVGDAHTAVKLPMKCVLPMEFYWFKEGIYVVHTLEEYKELEYLKVIEINNMPIKEVIDELKEIISYENISYLKFQVVKYIQAIEILYGLMIVDNIEGCSIKFETLEGEIKIENIRSIDVIEYNNLKNNKDFKIDRNSEWNKRIDNGLPLYRRNNNKNYWFEYLKKEQLLYFKYNLCKEREEETIEKFIINLIGFIEKNNILKLVVDLRNNTGGDSRLLDPFIEYIKNNENINKEGNLFLVIGRDTFSSALLNAFSFKNSTNATLIGEPTGGKPNCYGEIEKFMLPNSKFLITYSTEYYKLIEDDKCESLLPDINIAVGIKDFINEKDPVLEYLK